MPFNTARNQFGQPYHRASVMLPEVSPRARIWFRWAGMKALSEKGYLYRRIMTDLSAMRPATVRIVAEHCLHDCTAQQALGSVLNKVAAELDW